MSSSNESQQPVPDGSEEELTGGGTTRVVRVGDTVRRPVRPWTATVRGLLDHLEKIGFVAAPRWLGIDERDREILSYLPGEVGNYPLSADVRSEAALVSAARLLRAYHDGTVELTGSLTDGWQFPRREPVEVVCHGDFAPYNCVFADRSAVGIIDFDGARLGPRSWDLAYALYRFAPLTDPANGDGFGDLTGQARRARLFLDSYGCTPAQRGEALSTVPVRLASLVAFMTEAARHGDPNSARHIEEGHADLYRRDASYVTANGSTLTRLIVESDPSLTDR
jgi:hypothetical protein